MHPYNEKSSQTIQSVSEINLSIRKLIENRFNFVRIRGEISNVKQPISGHTYFNLKDEKSQLSAVLFKNQKRWLSQDLKDGQQIICDGRIGVYEPRGHYQLIIDTIDFDGTGHLQIRFEHLKQRLRAEGLFDTTIKKPLPESVDKIVLITSPSGAAIHDFLSICRKKKADTLIQILPVRVQGEGSSVEIIRAIDTAHSLEPDVIVLCRGGGSIEDLWAFNEEALARSIYAASIPIVSGVGHETDFTIADFCCDIRAATPTAAAEILIPDRQLNAEKINTLLFRIKRCLAYYFDQYANRLDHANHVFSAFDHAFSRHTLTVDSLLSRLNNSLAITLEKKHGLFSEAGSRLLRLSPEHRIELQQKQLKHIQDTLSQLMHHRLENKQSAFSKTTAVLDSLSPLATLARGYSIVSGKAADSRASGNIVTSIDQVAEGEEVDIKLHHGQLKCEVISKKVN